MKQVFDYEDDGRDNLKFLYDCYRYNRDPIAFYNEILETDFKPYYHKQEKIIREFHRDLYGKGSPYKYLILACGQRTGKSKLCYGEIIYGFFQALTINDRQSKYGIAPDQLISLAIAAQNKDTVEDGIYYDVTNILEKSEWFNSNYNLTIRASDITCKDLNIKIRPFAASSYSVAGRSNFRFAIDEIDLFISSIGAKSSMELYNVLTNSTATFGVDGKGICCSSPKMENGTILTLYNRANERDLNGKLVQKNVLSYKLPTWKLNSDPKLSENVLRELYKYDLNTFYRDFCADPRAAGGLFMPEGIIMSDIPNLLDDLDGERSEQYHIMAIDPAATSDKFGIAVGYYDLYRNMYVIDGVMYLSKRDGEEFLSPAYVWDVINKIIDRANVTTLIYDIYMYTELIEKCNVEKGIETIRHTVDKKDYDNIKYKQSYNQLEIVYDEYLQYEFKNLIVKKLSTKERVDHSPTSSKDIADCVAAVLWYLSNNSQNVIRPMSSKIFAF